MTLYIADCSMRRALTSLSATPESDFRLGSPIRQSVVAVNEQPRTHKWVTQ